MNTLLFPILAAAIFERNGGNGGGVVSQLLTVLLIGICVLIIWGVGQWVIKKFPGAPPSVLTVWNGFFILIGSIFAINFLLGLAGHPLFAW